VYVNGLLVAKIDNPEKVKIAAPRHQEMNGVAERMWQTVSNIMRCLLVHARLPAHFYHHALHYAVAVVNVLPSKGLVTDDGQITTPFYLAYDRKPKIGAFCVFGCPVEFDRYNPLLPPDEQRPNAPRKRLPRKQQLQRCTRGIHIGFAPHQQGHLVYVPEGIGPHHIITAYDMTFDENFESTLVHDYIPFSGARPIRTLPKHSGGFRSYTNSPPDEQTGSVGDFLVTNMDAVTEGGRSCHHC